MKVQRNGKIIEVKQPRTGDVYVTYCWLCEAVGMGEQLKNGFTKHYQDKKLQKQLEAQKETD